MAAVGGSAKELLKYVPLKTTYKRVSVVRNLTHLPHFFALYKFDTPISSEWKSAATQIP